MSINHELVEEPIVEVKENKEHAKWSYSRLSLFERCQRQYFHKYIEELPTPPSNPMKTGRILHRSLEWVLKYGYEPSEAVRFSIYEEGMPGGESFYTLLQMVENALYLVPTSPTEIETEIYIYLNTTLGLVRGYIDLLIDDPVNDTLELWDYKSGWQESEASDSKQLALYAWIISELRGAALPSKVIGKLIFPRINSYTEVVFTPNDLENARNWFIRTVMMIAAKSTLIDEWELTSEKKHCETCAFVGRCAAGLSDRNFSYSGEYATMDEAERAGEWILQQEALIKKLKSGLKKFVEEHEPVNVGTKSWFIKSSEPKPKVVDIRELMEFAEEKDLEVADVLNADSEKILKWLDEDETGMLEQLVEWTSVRKTLTYGVKKEKEDKPTPQQLESGKVS
ncbi:MAG: PD-(D/E)XK nuclease family protein [Psychrobacillus sp.]